MKTGMGLVKEFSDNWGAHADDECHECMAARQITEKLQAWLREADNLTIASYLNSGAREWVRSVVLGTTQEGK